MVTVKPALHGIATLVSLPTISPAEVTLIIEGIFQHVKMRALVQDVRFKVFSIIDTLMAYHRDVLKSYGRRFLDGYIPLAEGEKDPRNLMVAFAIARVLIIEFDISEHVESMFNILFCYFPITFRPPPNDRYGISSLDLKLALRNCLNATPAFGPLAIPVFLEKLSATSRATKRDTLQTLVTCLPVYGSALARVWARKLWNALKLEIFQPVDPETEEEALKATQALVKTIYVDEEEAMESNEDMHGLARDACEECIQILKEPEKSQAKPATKVLCTFLSTTPSVAKYAISQAIPHLIQLFRNPDEASARTATLFLLTEMIKATRDSAAKATETNSTLSPYKDDLLAVLTVGLKSQSTRNIALSGLNALCSATGLLSDEEYGYVVHNASELLEGSREELDESSDLLIELLKTISDIAPRHVVEQTLPILFSSLPDSAPARSDGPGREKCWQILSAVAKLCTQAELFENLVIRLTTKLDLLCFPSSEQVAAIAADPEPSAAYAHMILKALYQALASKAIMKHVDIAKYLDRLVPSLFNVFVSSAFLSEERPMVASEPRLIEVAGQIINLVVQSVPLQKQQMYAASLSQALLEGDVRSIAYGFQKVATARSLSIFNESSTPAQRNILHLLASAIIALHKEARLSLTNVDAFLDILIGWTLAVADNDLQKLSALHIVSSIVNRQADELLSFLNNKLELFQAAEICNQSLSLDRRRWAIKAWTWLTKALLVRKHALAMSFTEPLYERFNDEAISWDAAKAIGEIPAADKVLTKANHADVKILYVQRYVGVVLPRLIAFSKDGENPTKQTASLVALTSLIKSIPKAAYAHEIPSVCFLSFCYKFLLLNILRQLIPLLLRGLELPDSEIRSNIIDTLLVAAEGESPEKSLVAEHSTTLVNTMLKNSKVQDMPSSRVRISALRYLAILPSIVKYEVLHPYKATLLRELAVVLDDPKRSVRKEAVIARTNWFKYKG
ncbi:ARM repeat-containing protein [Agrocybe pediades]|nr:ARM repeat-containing protein [Agrocybe pediades]